MPNIRTIRNRIRSGSNTAKVTRAMEMIAASKMRRAQQRLLAGRPYSETIAGVMKNLAGQTLDDDSDFHPLMARREVKRIGIIHITPDRGLCGGLNANVNRSLGTFVLENSVPVSVVAAGRKGRDFSVRNSLDVRAVFIDMGDAPSLLDTIPIAKSAIEDYTNGYVDEVYVSYSRFVSTVVQRPVIEKILPIDARDLEGEADQAATGGDYIYEPSPIDVLALLLPRFVEMQVYHAILESIGSEQSARMVAMSGATDSASEMIQDLTLLMNKVRQASITTELLDIVGGVAALEG